MNTLVTSEKLINETAVDTWVQTHDYTPQERSGRREYGRMLAIISLKDTGLVEDAGRVQKLEMGREVLMRLHEEYFGKKIIDSLLHIQDALKTVFSEFSGDGSEIEIAVLIIKGKTLYLSCVGGATIHILRYGNLVKIIQSLSASEDVVAASGFLEDGDIFILSTSGFFEVCTMGEVKAALAGQDLRAASDSLVSKLVSAVTEHPSGALLSKIVVEPDDPLQIGSGAGNTPQKDVPRIARVEKEVSGAGGGILRRFLGSVLEKRIIVGEEKFEAKTAFQRRKTALSVGAILIVMLLSSVFFGLKRRAQLDFERSFGDRIAQAEHDLESARDLASLDPERSRELFAKSSALYEEMVNEGIEDERLISMMSELGRSKESILGVYEVDSEVFWDLTLLSEGFSGKELSKSDDTVYVLSSQGDRIASIRIENKRSRIEAGPSVLNGVERIASYVNRIFVISDRKLVEVTGGNEEEIDSVSVNNFLIGTFAGNVYLLNSNTSNIYRYSGDGRSFGGRRNWLAEGVGADFSNIISWAIDGTIWLLDGSGEISRYSAGNRVSFQPMGVYPDLDNPSALYAEEEGEGLYLLEPSKERVVVLGKDGNYKAQYVSEELGGAEKLVVSEERGVIIFLAGSKLHSIELKHL
jgi:hypothetical protein